MTPHDGRLRRRAVLAGLGALGATATFLVLSWLPGADDTAAPTTTSAPSSTPGGGSSATEPVAASAHVHAQPVGPTTTAERAETDDLLARAVVALPVRTVGDALAAGYVITNTQEGINDVHLARPSIVDDAFDPLEPEMLLAASRDDDAPIIAFVWWDETTEAPDGFPGGEDAWHLHEAFCNVEGGVHDMPTDEYERRGGTVATAGGWMLHAWVVPGHDNPNGRFAADNPRYPSGG